MQKNSNILNFLSLALLSMHGSCSLRLCKKTLAVSASSNGMYQLCRWFLRCETEQYFVTLCTHIRMHFQKAHTWLSNFFRLYQERIRTGSLASQPYFFLYFRWEEREGEKNTSGLPGRDRLSSPGLKRLEETINIRTPAIIRRSYTETKPRRYSKLAIIGRQVYSDAQTRRENCVNIRRYHKTL